MKPKKNKVNYVMDCTSCAQPQLLIPGQIAMLSHPLLHVAVCKECMEFSHSDFVPDDDEGDAIYCNWCTEVGLLVFCGRCKTPFCKDCIIRNFDEEHYNGILEKDPWICYICDPTPLTEMRDHLLDTFTYQYTGEVKDAFTENCQKKFKGFETTQSDREEIIRERIKLRHNTVLDGRLDSTDAQSEESEEDQELKKKKKRKKSHRQMLIEDSTDSEKDSTIKKTSTSKKLNKKFTRSSSKKPRKQLLSKTDAFVLKKKKKSDHKNDSNKSTDNENSSIEILIGEKSSEEIDKIDPKGEIQKLDNNHKKSTKTSGVFKKVTEPNDFSALWDDDLTIEENLPEVDIGIIRSTFSSEESDAADLLKEVKQKQMDLIIVKRRISPKDKKNGDANEDDEEEEGKKDKDVLISPKDKKTGAKRSSKDTNTDKEADEEGSEKKDKDVLSGSEEYMSLSEDDTPIDQRKMASAV